MKYIGVIEYAHQTDDIIREAIRHRKFRQAGTGLCRDPDARHCDARLEADAVACRKYRLVSHAASAPMIDAAVAADRPGEVAT